ncbi:uncharacterized protein YjiS (DUF1127 family) [Bradyrhizobium japonicum]|uniref:YjiS-like domain-containing protein n=1 Tax=Bradyrhizobium diazoefficiens TaxID=1355477 RepID=A0A809YP16_9BRAD|nr:MULTISPECIES: DUF1127 domain-containing protein [Bradyrhizobium]MBP1063836.1 uncharacterized protein YjiS (DUF1127 family) [Bradyrhizobium japonicum]MDA9535996.1 hypothetical protein [Bradyrhizobium sp. CCBAU 21362]BCA05769.1 hypothetical protein H12S4_66730 [Bradyrhizobium diazoefficiens]BCA23122.1 hypothetical protein BDHH15_63370 [Bradyrhizobium diazoefficiens]BCE32493.1 hypothetical protein XF2B_62620 [Bradyrhizobium diazoefficiens]
MPPQQTNITSETGGDAARLRLDLSTVLSLLKRYWLAFRDRRQSPRVSLQDLSDRELVDIGLTRGEIDYLTPERAIDRLRDGTTGLWGRGVM